MNVAHVRSFVRQSCEAPENHFGPSFYSQHLEVVSDYALRLADRHGADREIVEIAAYLHDLSAVLDFKTLPTHASDGAGVAGDILGKMGYPADRIKRIQQAILTHSSPVAPNTGTPEQVCLSQADAISQIVRPTFWSFYVFSVRKMGFDEGRGWLRSRVETNWNALSPEARDLITDIYGTVSKTFELGVSS